MPRNESCTACPLHERAQHVCLWGEQRGGGRIRVLLLGENPGWNEDQQGRPFVGAAGNLLNEALTSADLLADDLALWLTNVTKCTKGSGTIPAGAAKACAPYLEDEIATFKPQFILAMGNEAIQRLIGRGRVTEIEGKEIWSDKYKCWIMPIRHPAAVLRAEGFKPAWLLIFHRFEKLIRGAIKPAPPVEVRLVRSASEAWKLAHLIYIYSPPAFAYDFETGPPGRGLEWWAKDFKAYTIAFSFARGKAVVVPLEHPESFWTGDELPRWYATMRQAMTQRNIMRFPHNMLFDDLVWWRVAGYQPYATFDTMAEVQLTDENQPKGLKWQGMARLGWPNWDIGAAEEHPLKELAFYNGCDAAATFELHHDQLYPTIVSDPDLHRYYLTCGMPTYRALERMMMTGIHVDMDTLNDHLGEAVRQRERAMALLPMLENPGSPDQVAVWLYDALGLPVYKRTPTGKPSTDEETINRLAQHHPAAKDVLAYRRPNKNITTYFLPIARHVGLSFDGRYHPEMRHTSVETGRLSGFFHTTPRDPFVRSVYSAPPGWTLVQADNAQVEARLAAWRAAGCPTSWDNLRPEHSAMLRLFLAGRDVYVYVAAQALRKPAEEVTPNERQIMGKVPTLAMIYRVSWRGFQEYAWKEFEIEYSDQEAAYLHSTFHRIFPEIGNWHAWEERVLRDRGWTESFVHRKRRLPEAMSTGSVAYHAVNSGINAPIQSTANELTQAAFILLTHRLDPDEARIVGNDHDALIVEVRDDIVTEVATRIQYYMENSSFALRSLGLYLPAGLIQTEVTVGPWGRGKPVEDWLKIESWIRGPSLTTPPASA